MWLDIFFLVILTFTSVYGLFKGLIKEVSSIVGLVLGIIAANQYYQPLGATLGDMSVGSPYAGIIAYLAIFAAVLFAAISIGVILKKLLKISMLGWVDKLAGGIFGFLKGTLIICVLMLILTFVLQANSPILQDSRIAPFFTNFNQSFSSLIPKDIKQGYMQKSKRLEQAWENHLQPILDSNKTQSAD